MKISIYDNNEKLAYNPNKMKHAGVSGTQTIIIEVARELVKRGHDVTVYIKCNFPDIYDGVKYYKHSDYKPLNEDVLIGFESLPKIHNVKKVFNWSTRVAINDVVKHENVDNLIVLSEWHRDRYASELPHKLVKKTVVIEPGVNKYFFEPKTKKWHKSITYAGHPAKGGMKALIEFAKRLKPKLKIDIHAYGGGQLWGWDDLQYRSLYDLMIKNKILYHGQIGKKKMIIQLNKTELFVYPVSKNFQETFCMIVLEAMASGCVVIASDNGPIKSIVGDTGYIIKGNVEDYKWHIEAVEKVLSLYKDSALMLKLSKKAEERAKEFSWQKTVDKLEKLF